MGRSIALGEITEFSIAGLVPEAAVTDEVLRGISTLDERVHVEPWLRTLIGSANETHHGPTEIADILTARLTVGGVRRLAALVLKGKSLPSVTAAKVAHQIMRLEHIPQVTVIGMMVTGRIQDDAVQAFTTSASHMGADFFIAERMDLARLFIAAKMVCSLDGLPFVGETCSNGHARQSRVKLDYHVRERPKCDIVEVKDASHGLARRLAAHIIVDPHYPKEAIRESIEVAVQEVRNDPYYATEALRQRWQGQPADVVWVFVAADLDDKANCNWVCRACWNDPKLPPDRRQSWDATDDDANDVAIVWNSSYYEMKALLGAASAGKGALLEAVRKLLGRAGTVYQAVYEAHQDYVRGKLGRKAFIHVLSHKTASVDQLYREAGNLPVPPFECKEYELAFQCFMAHLHTIRLYCTDQHWLSRDADNWNYLIRRALEDAQAKLDELRQEEARLRR